MFSAKKTKMPLETTEDLLLPADRLSRVSGFRGKQKIFNFIMRNKNEMFKGAARPTSFPSKYKSPKYDFQ